MITLLLTLFISLFSYCPSIYKVEDHIENNVESVEFKPKEMGYIDRDNSYQLFMFYTDISSDYFFTNFVNGVSNDYPSIGFGSYETDLHIFDNLGSYFLKLENGVVKSVALKACDKIALNKYNISYGGEYRIFSYYLSFYYNNVELLTYDYRVSVPLFEWNYVQASAYSVTSCDLLTISSDLSGFNWAYFEDSSYMDNTPLIDYYLPSLLFNQTFYDLGYRDGELVGYQRGFIVGYNEGSSVDATASTIFTGILDVALIPVNVFLTIFNFEVFGINIAGIVSALLTISVVVIIIRFVTGKNDD